MSTIPIDIDKSIKTEKLVFKKSRVIKFIDRLFELPLIIVFVVFSVMYLHSKINHHEPLGLAIFFVIIAITVSGMLCYSHYHINSLTRIEGQSLGQNAKIIKAIAENQNWQMAAHSGQMTIIKISWKDALTDWGKQLTILYDNNDILVNCMSYELFATPSPFHWFANRKKVNILKSEFHKRVKNLQ